MVAIVGQELGAGGAGGIALLLGPVQLAARRSRNFLTDRPGDEVADAEHSLDPLRRNLRICVPEQTGSVLNPSQVVRKHSVPMGPDTAFASLVFQFREDRLAEAREGEQRRR